MRKGRLGLFRAAPGGIPGEGAATPVNGVGPHPRTENPLENT